MDSINSTRRTPFGSNPEVGSAGRATQQRILAAANDAFIADGYTRTTVEAITDLAGCSRPTFYQYFSGKEDVHRRLAGQFGRELAQLVDGLEAVGDDRDGRDRLHTWLVAFVDVYDRYQAVANTFTASLRTDNQMVTGAATLSDRYRDALARALDSHRPTRATLPALTATVNSMAYGACLYRERIGDVDPGRLADALADSIHRTFFGPLDGVNLGPRTPGTGFPEPDEGARPETDDASNGSPRRARGRATRARLLDAATVAFGTLGYDRVRVDDIAAEAGTSHGTFYRYFTDKEAVFSAHAHRTATAIADRVDTLTADTDPLEWTRAYYELYAHDRPVISCLREARAAGVAAADDARGQVANALLRALERRSFGDTDADLVVCFSLLENVPAAPYGYTELPLDHAIDASAVVLARGILGREP